MTRSSLMKVSGVVHLVDGVITFTSPESNNEGVEQRQKYRMHESRV